METMKSSCLLTFIICDDSPTCVTEGPAQHNFLSLELWGHYHFLWDALGRGTAVMIRNGFWKVSQVFSLFN